MIIPKYHDLLSAGVHFGHLRSRWNPKMSPFIFMENRGLHIIDLHKTLDKLQESVQALRAMASEGKRILFVATKKQARKIVAQEAKKLGMPYVTERWLGGTLTNFVTIRRLIKKMTSSEKLMRSDTYHNMAKKEQLMIVRAQDKLEKLLSGLSDTTRLPAALFVVDANKERIAVQEAHKIGIPVFALVDTNTDPTSVDYPIPGNDDSSRSITLLIQVVSNAIAQGLKEKNQRKQATQEGDTKEGVPIKEMKQSILKQGDSSFISSQSEKVI